VVDLLIDECDFSKDSVFLDIGAGLGKPNFHAAISPGVKLSLGVELIGTRWWQSMSLLLSALDEHDIRQESGNCFFAHADCTDMNSFDPVTHVYSFNRGFPPYAMRAVAKAFHNSLMSEYFICFDKLKKLEDYGFQLELVDYVTTKMAGSGEQHRCFVYKKRKSIAQPILKSKGGERTPVQFRTRRARKDNAKVVTETYKKVSSSKVRTEFLLPPPPADVSLAPCIPHSDSYMNGLDNMKGIILYKEYVKTCIGLTDTTRSRRTTRRRNVTQE